jgi:hypothetical protein
VRLSRAWWTAGQQASMAGLKRAPSRLEALGVPM